MKVGLQFDVREGGWATFRLTEGTAVTEVVASYLNDSLTELLESTSALLKGVSPVEVVFVDEPGHVVMTLAQDDPDTVSVTLHSYDTWPGRVRGGRQLLRTRLPVLRLAQQAAAVAEQIRVGLGEEEYARRWRTSFPAAALARLQSAFSQRRDAAV